MPPHRAGITVTITNLQNTCFHWCNIESPIQSNCIFPLPASLLQSPIYKTCVSTGVTENHQFKAIASFRCQHHCYNHQFTKHSLPSNTPVGFGFRIITHKDSKWDFGLARTDNFGHRFYNPFENSHVGDALLASHARSGDDTCQRFTCLSCGSPACQGQRC